MAQLNAYEAGDYGSWGKMHRGQSRSWSYEEEEEENDWSRMELPPSRPSPHRRRRDPIPRPAKSAYAAPSSAATSRQHPAVTRCASVLLSSPSGMRHHNPDTPPLGRYPAVPSIPRAATAPTGKLSFQQQQQQHQQQQHQQYQQYQQYQRSPSGSRRAPSQRDLSPQYRSTPVSRRSMRSSLGESDNETDLTRPTPEEDEDENGDFAGPARSVFAERPSLRDRLGGATKRSSQDFTSSSPLRQKPTRKQKPLQPKNQTKQKHALADLDVDVDADEATLQNDLERERERDRKSSILQQHEYPTPPYHNSYRHPSRGRSTRGLRREDSIREETPREERQADAHTEMDKDDFSEERRRTRRQQTPPRRTRRSVSQNPTESRGASRSKSRVRARDADEFNPRASSRRPTKRYCETEVPDYAGSPATLRRAQTHGPASHVNASSITDSPKRPASLFESPLDNGSYVFTAEKHSKRATCFICKDELSPSRMTQLECGHWLCTICLKHKFKASLTDSRQMPPTCCTTNPIPVKHVDKLLEAIFKRDWNERHYEVSLNKRMYCFKCGSTVSSDSRFRESNGVVLAQCGRCRTKLCIRCHHKAHGSNTCPSDPKTERILDKLRKEGRQQCHKCKAKVEHADGRNHLICGQCHTESCMICGGRWGHCDCPVFDYDLPELGHVDYSHGQFATNFIRHDRYASTPSAPAPAPAPAPSMAATQRDIRSRNQSSEWPFSAARPMRSRAHSFDEKSRIRSRADDFSRAEDLSRRLDYRAFNDTMDNDEDEDDQDARTEAYTRSVYKSRFDTQRSRQPSRTRAEDDFAIRPRRRRSFVVDDFERAETDILPSVPQPPPAPPSPPQQKAQAESVIVHRQQFHHQQHPQHHQHQHQHQQHQQHQPMLPPQPDMHAYQPPHMQHMQHPPHPQHIQPLEPRPRQPITPSQHPGDFYNGTPTRQRPAAHVDSDVGRLAGRFNKDPRPSPMHRSAQQPPSQAQGLPMASMTATMSASMPMGMTAAPAALMGPMPPHMPPMIGMGPQAMPQPPQSIHPMAMMPMPALPPVDHMSGMRMGRPSPYVMEDSPYAQSELAAMYPGSQVPFTDSNRHYESLDTDAYTGSGGMNRRMRRRDDIQQNQQAKPSEMAGLGGFGRGMDRVSEWMAYVSREPPEEASTIASSVEAT